MKGERWKVKGGRGRDGLRRGRGGGVRGRIRRTPRRRGSGRCRS